ncbi:MFS transporter [Streptomyces sp. NPDC016172]|uniref:MFS transporter n=1 Tax=Streptomyces sp. NPDC016172 TaxID=3364964 RepID=UPI0036F8164A
MRPTGCAAYLRSVTNVGFSVGTVAGGLALDAGSRAVYTAELLAGGAVFVVAGVLLLALPELPPVPADRGESRWAVLRDRPYVAVGLLNAVLITNSGILNVALPLWIAERTHALTSVFAGLLLTNTVLVVLGQVPVSRGAEDVRGGARAMRRSGLWLAACCVLFAFAAGRPSWFAVGVLAVGVVVHTMGELLYSAGSWALSYELAPEHAHGQYQGLFGPDHAAGHGRHTRRHDLVDHRSRYGRVGRAGRPAGRRGGWPLQPWPGGRNGPVRSR